MKIKILTLFPKMVEIPLGESVIKRAVDKGAVEFSIFNIRDSATDKHSTVDDTPYGGGGGMVMMPEPLCRSLEQAVNGSGQTRIILTSAAGKKFDQKMAQELSQEESLIFICGHYTGVDERVKEFFPIEEVSIGDYVLTGGDLPALVMIDAIVRLIPGVLGNFESAEYDSFQNVILGYPQYTKPQEFNGKKVPEVLVSGHHAQVARWRRLKALEQTYRNRPDLLERINLTDEEKKFLHSLTENNNRG